MHEYDRLTAKRKNTDWIDKQNQTLDTIARERGRTWDSPTGSWKTYTAITEDHDRQAALDNLRYALDSLNYVSAWANLDSAERDSLSSAISRIHLAIKEFSR